ncbi:kinetochore-associated protein NSL1 homolog [Boleophthalmus pectinirostris]|uniref:kinetochore-associated protein NSL1 homolog n=1 Tax=Boleophthalmus pectinirostris TaxID=150288 RepID=UPI000A1C64C1|nr:kinetochore-associated protein NSL1 homolog [Boleophthalmus pectinirostris]
MEAVQPDKISSEDPSTEYRIQVRSKKQVQEQIERYKELLKTVLDGQTELAADTKRELLGELLANFEAAVQENVLVNGQTWSDAPDDEEEVDLESQLDDVIVETSRKRRTYPRKILPHVVHALKAERKIMGLYEKTIQPQDMPKDTEQESIMKMLSAEAPGLAKQATQVIKSIQTLQKQAEGLCQILNSKPSAASLEIHREVFGNCDESDAFGPPFKHQEPIRRLAKEMSAANCYIPLDKKYGCNAAE